MPDPKPDPAIIELAGLTLPANTVLPSGTGGTLYVGNHQSFSDGHQSHAVGTVMRMRLLQNASILVDIGDPTNKEHKIGQVVVLPSGMVCLVKAGNLKP